MNIVDLNGPLSIIRWAMLVSIFLYAYVAETVTRQRPATDDPAVLDPTMFIILAALAAVSAVVALVVRSRLNDPAQEFSATPAPLSGMPPRALYILLCAFAEAVALFGFVVRFLGGTVTQSIAFYAVGVGLLLISPPPKLH